MSLLTELIKKFGGTMENVYRLSKPEGAETLEKIARLIVDEARGAKKGAEKFFQFIGEIAIPATTEEFVASEKFVVNTSEDAPVKIFGIGEDFQERYLRMREKPFSDSTLIGRKLVINALDEKIISELGGEPKAVTTLTEVYGAMVKQRNGKSGKLLTSGRANIFYVYDIFGELGAVDVYWDGDGWHVSAYELVDEWRAGRAVFSRN